MSPPGSIRYQMSIYTKAIDIVPDAVGRVPLEQLVGHWSFSELTMGLLVRVSNVASSSSTVVMCSTPRTTWVSALPHLIYLGSAGTHRVSILRLDDVWCIAFHKPEPHAPWEGNRR